MLNRMITLSVSARFTQYIVTGIAPGKVLINANYKDFKDTAPLTVVKQ